MRRETDRRYVGVCLLALAWPALVADEHGRVVCITPGWVMVAITRMRAPQRGHCSMSMLKTRFNHSAQDKGAVGNSVFG
ncbi:MAG: hypothetical protein GXP16_15280 [Gammaproteobacteria bacterium]|nr:hypothetical protein [Gammaproteobacteria bacterium]